MKRPACLVGLCLIFFLGLLFYLKMPEPYSDESISGRSISLNGTVDDKYSKNTGSYLVIKNAIIISGEDSKIKHKVIVKLKERKESLAMLPPIGSEVTAAGKGMLFSRARNPGNFDLAQYEMIRGIDFEIYDSDIISFSKKKRSLSADEGMCLLRERLSESIDGIFAEKEAGIIKAMLLGDRTELGDEIRDAYRRSGMSHILCISALHITLLGMGFLRLSGRLKIKKAASYAMCCAFIMLYGRFTGSGVSTVRALITFSLMMTADLVGRTPDILSSMSLAGIVIILIRPLYILDTGFILSFSAVSGIGILGPVTEKLLPHIKGISGALGTSLSVTLFMLPETLYFFLQIPLFSIPINLVVIPLLGVLLVSALISVTVGCISITLGLIASLPAKLILSLYTLITTLNDRLPLSLLTPGRPEMWQISIYYLILITIAFIVERAGKKSIGKLRLICPAVVAAAILLLTVHIRAPLSLTMADVGQGDCHFMESAGKTVMIDCGSSDVDMVAKYRVIPYVLSRGYDRIDCAILTHPDMDHINGYLEMLEMGDDCGLDIRSFIVPDITGESKELERLETLAKGRGIKVMKIKTGDTFCVGKLNFRCLNPERGACFSDMNEISVCLSVEFADSGFMALYTGDVEGSGEKAMMKHLYPLKGRYALLKCAHHGSRESTPPELLEIITPVYAFISAGEDNRYGHPHKELIKRLENADCRIHITKEEGAVRMDTNGRNIKITHYIQGAEEK